MQTYHIIIDKNQKEQTRHGVYGFPLAVYRTEIKKNVIGFVNWHWHEELQLCLILRGTVNFNVNGESLLVSAGEGIYINKSQLHMAQNAPGSDGAYICLDFQECLLQGFEGSVFAAKYLMPYVENQGLAYILLKPAILWQREVLDKIRAIYHAYEEKAEGYEMGILIELLEIWQRLVLCCFSQLPDRIPGDNRERCKQIITYIREHYAEKIVLADLARAVSLSEGTCCREFKEAMKCTIFEYLMNYRLTESARLLLTTEASINDVAYQCGFSNASYFIDQFRKKTTITPGAYRKKMK